MADPCLGFLIVASTLAVACGCCLLQQVTTNKARGLLALLMTVLHTILSGSVMAHVSLAAEFSSQRELSVLHCCADLSQLFVVQLIATRLATKPDRNTLQPQVLAVAGTLLLDSGNLIYMALLGMWDDIAEGGGLPVYRMGLFVWSLRHVFFSAVVHKSCRAADLPGNYRRAMPAALGLTSAIMITVTLVNSEATLPGGYFPVCVLLMFLPHVRASPIQLVYAGFASVACWLDLASGGFIVAHIWFSALVAAADYYQHRHIHNALVRAETTHIVDSADKHRATLLPVLIHAVFVVGFLAREDSTTAIEFGAVMLLADFLYCVIVGWWTLDKVDEQSTSQAKWVCQWMSLFTTGLVMLCMPSGLSSFGTVVGIVIIGAGGLLLVEASPRADTAYLSSQLAAVFVLLVDGVPVVNFIVVAASATFDTSLDAANSTGGVEDGALTTVHLEQGSALVFFAMVVFMYKVLVCLWYSVFELKANCGNTTQTSWAPVTVEFPPTADIRKWSKMTRIFAAVWSFLLLHGVLTLASAKAALNTLGTVPSDGNHCVGEAHPDAFFSDTFRCASPTDMLTVDVVVFLGVAIMFMLLVGEAVNKTRGDEEATWPDSLTAKVAENALQMLLTGQVLYSMLRLRTQPDPLYVLFCMLDLTWVFLLMLSRQFREGYGAVATAGNDRPTITDWAVMYCLEAWDVVNSLIVTVAIARDTEYGWPTWIADTYVVFFVLTLFLFQVSYPFWTSLKRIAMISCFNDLVTDGPMLYLMVAYELYDKSTVTAIAAFVNICIIAIGVVIWPLKYYIKEYFDESGDDDNPVGGAPVDDADDNDDDSSTSNDEHVPPEGAPFSERQVKHFCDATGADKQTARNSISAAGGIVEKAIQDYWNGGGVARP